MGDLLEFFLFYNILRNCADRNRRTHVFSSFRGGNPIRSGQARGGDAEKLLERFRQMEFVVESGFRGDLLQSQSAFDQQPRLLQPEPPEVGAQRQSEFRRKVVRKVTGRTAGPRGELLQRDPAVEIPVDVLRGGVDPARSPQVDHLLLNDVFTDNPQQPGDLAHHLRRAGADSLRRERALLPADLPEHEAPQIEAAATVERNDAVEQPGVAAVDHFATGPAGFREVFQVAPDAARVEFGVLPAVAEAEVRMRPPRRNRLFRAGAVEEGEPDVELA